MSTGGYGVGGSSGFGPSELFRLLPGKSYRDPLDDGSRAWLEEWIDAIGLEFDGWFGKQIGMAARAALLDPTTPDAAATDYLATPTQAPKLALSRDTMLDVLLYIVLASYPVDSNISIAGKQGLVQVGWDALRLKGARLQMMRLVAALTGGVVYAVSVPGQSFGIVAPDGAPSPGFGAWVPPSASTNGTQRPWLFAALQALLLGRSAPAWSQLGVGYSQFRASHSAAGEPVLPVGSRINLLAHEHFDAWGGGVPTGWSKTATGVGAALTQSTVAPAINFEFTANAAVLDLTGAGVLDAMALSQFGVLVNDQVAYRVELDYAYRQAAAPFVAKLALEIFDETNGLYFDGAAWGAFQTAIWVPPSATATTRTRFALRLPLSLATASTFGTGSLRIKVVATSDGTVSSNLAYTLYRVGLYEIFSADVEAAALGERTLWMPLHDALGAATFARAGGGTQILEPADVRRAGYKALAANAPEFPYHPALSGRGYRSSSEWVNYCQGGSDFGTDWTRSNATRTANSQISPLLGEATPTAPLLTATAIGASILQAGPSFAGFNPQIIAGLWVKKPAGDVAAGLASTSINSTAVLGNGTAFSAAWVGLKIQVGSVTGTVVAVADGTHLTLDTPAHATVVGGAITLLSDRVTLTVKCPTGVTTIGFSRDHVVSVADGWVLLAMPSQPFQTGDRTHGINVVVKWAAAAATAAIAAAGAYLCEVHLSPGVVHPPIAATGIGATGAVETTTLNVNVTGTNQHPLTLRQMTTLSAGALSLTIVPTFDFTQPAGTIFDFGESLTKNRLVLRIETGGFPSTLQATLYDDASTAHSCAISISNLADPPAGSLTWLRDTAIEIHLRWDVATGLDLAAGAASARLVNSGAAWSYSDANLAGIGIGNNFTGGAGQFDGLIRDVEVVQIGPPLP